MMFLEYWKSLSPLTFSYLLSISASEFVLHVLLVWIKLHPQKVYQSMLGCYQKTMCNKSLSAFQTVASPHFPLNFNIFLPTKIKIKLVQVASGTSTSKPPFKSPFYRFHFQILTHCGTTFEFVMCSSILWSGLFENTA